MAASSWPPPTEQVDASLQAFGPLFADPALEVHRDRWLATIRLRGPASRRGA